MKQIAHITKEQREAWDKITGPGLYNVEGPAAYEYAFNRVKWLVNDPTDPHTVLLIGLDEHKETGAIRRCEPPD